ASYRSTAAATLTLSDSTRPSCGIATARSHVRRTSGRSPLPSAPKTNASPPDRSACHIGVPDSPTAAATQTSPLLISPRYRARLGTTATGRCSTAPAEARQTAGVTRAEPWAGTTTPFAPAPSALRQTAPRLRGSLTWSRQASSGRSAATSSYASAYGYGSHQ